MKLYCCGCEIEVKARLTDGREIYPHRPDLAKLPFWKCDTCGNYVGCHHKTRDRTKPLGCIPTPDVRQARRRVHALLDPLWQKGLVPRKKVYKMVSGKLGYSFHSSEMRSVGEAKKVYKILAEILDEADAMESEE